MKNEIKKLLYKQKPKAELLFIRKGVAYYDTVLVVEEEPMKIHKTFFFEVPIEDMGEADFLPEMDAKLLIRWLVINVSDLE